MNRTAAVFFIVIVVLFSLFEMGRWRRPELAGVLNDTQKGRRLIGMLLLLILSVMVFYGTYLPPPMPYVPKVMRDFEMLYWLFFALLTVFLPMIAFFEFKDSLRRASQLRRDVYREIVAGPLDDVKSDDDATKKNSH